MTAVTVLMPVHNGERFVGEAIESILRQSFADFELLIVDDGSTDGTSSVLASFRDPRIRVLVNDTCLGLAKSLNRGLAVAAAPLIARQDADDRSHPDRLGTQVAFLSANPDVVLVGAQVRLMDARGRVFRAPGWWRPLSDAAIRFQMLFENPFIHSSVLFRKAMVGAYDEDFASAEDFELWSRVAGRHPVRNLPQALVDYRRHPDSQTMRFADDHLARCSAVFARNLRRAIGEVPAEWCRVLSAPFVRQEIDGRELIKILTAIFERFLQCHPQARGDREIREVMAAKMGWVARLLARTQRGAALHALTRSCTLRFL